MSGIFTNYLVKSYRKRKDPSFESIYVWLPEGEDYILKTNSQNIYF